MRTVRSTEFQHSAAMHVLQYDLKQQLEAIASTSSQSTYTFAPRELLRVARRGAPIDCRLAIVVVVVVEAVVDFCG